MSRFFQGVSTPRTLAAFSAAQDACRTADKPGSITVASPIDSSTSASAAFQSIKFHATSSAAQNKSSSSNYLKLAISQIVAVTSFYFATEFYLESDDTIPVEIMNLILDLVIVALLTSSCLVSLASISKPRFSDTRTVAGEIEHGLEPVDMDPVASLSAAAKRQLIRQPWRYSPPNR